jgi:hypothetical protein
MRKNRFVMPHSPLGVTFPLVQEPAIRADGGAQKAGSAEQNPRHPIGDVFFATDFPQTPARERIKAMLEVGRPGPETADEHREYV